MNPTVTPTSPLGLLDAPIGREPSLALRFLWWCAGADGQLLARCPTDYIKYGNIGATVVLTAVLAFISMSYALNAVFATLWAALCLGVVWAVVIFVLDRSIVSSMRKPPAGSGVFSKAGLNELLFLLVRMAVAVVISFTISKPLEVKIFEKRIVSQINKDKLRENAEANKDINSASGVNSAEGQLKQASEDLQDIRVRAGQEPTDQQYVSLKQTLAQQNADYKSTIVLNNNVIQKNLNRIASIERSQTVQELDSNGNPHNVLSNAARNDIGALLSANRKLNQGIKNKKNLAFITKNKLDGLIEKHQAQLTQEREAVMKGQQNARRAKMTADSAANIFQTQTRKANEQTFGEQENGTYPLMTQISELGKLTDADPALLWASRLITLLFLVIELAPILVKLFSKRGAYDEEMELAEHMTWVRTQYEKSQINSRINRKLDAINQTDERVRRTVEARQNKTFETATKNIEQQQQIELANNERLLKLIAKRQVELAEQLVEQWHQTELSKLKNNPSTNGATVTGTVDILPLPTSSTSTGQVP